MITVKSRQAGKSAGKIIKMNNRGMTLVEIMVTVAIVGILSVALGFQFTGWKARYDVEKTIRDVYTSLTDARTRALQTSRVHFFDISPNSRYYRVTDDDGNVAAGATAKLASGDGIFQEQRTWALIQASGAVNWGAVTIPTDTTITQLSRRIELPNNPSPAFVAFTSPQHAGLLIGFYAFPQYGFTFRVGFDKRGVGRNMIGSINPVTGAFGWAPATDIQNAVTVSHPNWFWGNPTICVFTDYDGNGTSDSDPDYDCIVVSETKISVGKIIRQNTGGDWCREPNCAIK